MEKLKCEIGKTSLEIGRISHWKIKNVDNGSFYSPVPLEQKNLLSHHTSGLGNNVVLRWRRKVMRYNDEKDDVAKSVLVILTN